VSADRWAGIAEVGSAWALRFGARVHRIVGRRVSLLLIWLAVFYYYLRNGRARRASRRYLERVRAAQEARRVDRKQLVARSAFRHMHAFALNLYDRFLVWNGALDRMEMQHTGSGEIFDLVDDGRGALLLGAHLGSIDMLWFLSRRHNLMVNVVVFFGNAQRINRFLESLNPEAKVRVIDIDPGSVRAAFEIRACIQRGEIVVVLADRMAPGKTTRAAETTFLGHPARFPLAPFQLAGMLGCPVLLALCLRRGDARYETVLSPLAGPERVPRAERDKRAREVLEKYVALLESYCLELPLQWFNFYDFWERER
jgi:predicted LPLAT superfamily acyltransferase